MLRRTIANRRMFRFTSVARPYSTAGYGNVTTSHQNPEQAPLDIEDPQEFSATPSQQLEKNQAQQSDNAHEAQQAKEKSDHDQKVKQQRKDFNRGDQDSVRQYSQGCD